MSLPEYWYVDGLRAGVPVMAERNRSKTSGPTDHDGPQTGIQPAQPTARAHNKEAS